jgi:hypothetical protein
MAIKASDTHAQRHGLAEARQVGWTAIVAAVNGRTGRATGRAPTIDTARMRDDDEAAVGPDDAFNGAAR